MSDKFVKFKLIPGQSAPADGFSTGVTIGDGWIVWKASDTDKFPDNDPHSNRSLNSKLMTEDEIKEFVHIIENPQPAPGGIEEMLDIPSEPPPEQEIREEVPQEDIAEPK